MCGQGGREDLREEKVILYVTAAMVLQWTYKRN